MRLRLLPSVLLLAASALPAAAQGTKALPYDHLHMASPDPAAARDWYIKNMGANPGETPDRAAFGPWTGKPPLPVQFMWNKTENAAPSEGSAIASVGLSFADLDAKVKALEAAGVKIVSPVQTIPGAWKRAVVQDPWGVTLELVQDPQLLGFHHITLRVSDPEASLKWYVNAFGAERAKMAGQYDAVKVGGYYLVVQKADNAAPSQGRAIDHLGFGPTDMDATAADLKGKMVTFATEPAPRPNQFGHRTAFIDGPGGVRIELVMHAELQK
jgi:catechol 2,3-dioxygenase-like lactoylglutathione lyase family enzyme